MHGRRWDVFSQLTCTDVFKGVDCNGMAYIQPVIFSITCIVHMSHSIIFLWIAPLASMLEVVNDQGLQGQKGFVLNLRLFS